MKKRGITGLIFRIAVVLLGCVVVASSASASDGGGRHHGKKGEEFGFGVFKQLNLTAAQKSSILEIMDKYDPQLDALRTDIRQARQEMRTRINASPFDESQVRAAYQQMSPLQENMFVLREKMKNEMRSLLTAEQVKLLDQKRESWGQKIQGRRDHRQAMIKKWLEMNTNETP